METAHRRAIGVNEATPDDLRRYLTEENHALHETAAHDVWREVLRRNDDLLQKYGKWIHPAYVEGIRSLALPTRIPRADELNARLEPTGWRIVSVDGYIPTAAYAGLMAASIFPLSRVIRRPEHIDFAPAPDMVHDILGHLPMLFCPEFRRYLKQLAKVMTKAMPNAWDQEFYDAVRQMAELKSDPTSPLADVAAAEARVNRVNLALADDASEVTALRRLYVWSIEFGLLGEPGDFRVHGAALLSSPAEFRAVRARDSLTLPYSLQALRHENAFSEVLTQYFVARDFAQYENVLAEYESTMRWKPDGASDRDAPALAPTGNERGVGHA
jgi:phenylalanine-4-hydroxylase